jgi:hypothetical protein
VQINNISANSHSDNFSALAAFYGRGFGGELIKKGQTRKFALENYKKPLSIYHHPSHKSSQLKTRKQANKMP